MYQTYHHASVSLKVLFAFLLMNCIWYCQTYAPNYIISNLIKCIISKHLHYTLRLISSKLKVNEIQNKFCWYSFITIGLFDIVYWDLSFGKHNLKSWGFWVKMSLQYKKYKKQAAIFGVLSIYVARMSTVFPKSALRTSLPSL